MARIRRRSGIAYLEARPHRALPTTPPRGSATAGVTHLRVRSGTALLWAATEGGFRAAVKDGRVAKRYPLRTACPAMPSSGRIEDAGHSIWLYLPCGLGARMLRPETGAPGCADPRARRSDATLFDRSDGVTAKSVGRHRLATLARVTTVVQTGKLWFSHPPTASASSIRGILPFNKLPPPVDIEQVTADGKTYLSSRPDLRLPPRVRDLTIDYTALSLVAPEKVHFRFRLEGQDKDWREVVNQRQVQYSNLAPGALPLPRDCLQ